mgnify:CR=1 FL=1
MDLLEYIISEMKTELADVSPALREQMQTSIQQYARELYDEITLLHTGEKPKISIPGGAPLPEQTPEVST